MAAGTRVDPADMVARVGSHWGWVLAFGICHPPLSKPQAARSFSRSHHQQAFRLPGSSISEPESAATGGARPPLADIRHAA
jgi:hypothetical protein